MILEYTLIVLILVLVASYFALSYMNEGYDDKEVVDKPASKDKEVTRDEIAEAKAEAKAEALLEAKAEAKAEALLEAKAEERSQEIPQPPPSKPLVDMPPVKVSTKTDKEPEPNQAPDPTMSAFAESAEATYSEEAVEKAPQKVPQKATQRAPVKIKSSRAPPKKLAPSKAQPAKASKK